MFCSGKIQKLFFLVFLLVSGISAVAENTSWILGAQKFNFTQPKNRSESSEMSATVLPQLILERISAGEIRTIPDSESLDRKLKTLETERLSLFLQLSKENQVRDSLILSSTSSRKLEKDIKNEQKKILELEEKIKENLKKAEDEKSFIKTEKKSFSFFNNFPFFSDDNSEEIKKENVTLYKNEAKTLFASSSLAQEEGEKSWNFEKEVIAEKINGLITGKITAYGEYCIVNVDLYVYPGAKIAGSVTEVGMLGELMPLADRIAQKLSSIISNSLPVLLEFDIKPENAFDSCVVSIDGVVHSLKNVKGAKEEKEKSTLLDAGIHRIEIESPGYDSVSCTYTFTDRNVFTVSVHMEEKSEKSVNIRLKKYRDGLFFVEGLQGSETDENNQFSRITINGKNAMGVFKIPENAAGENYKGKPESNIAFFRIPENKAFDGAYLVVNAKPYDREYNIDKRRRWMYTAYTGLICSLPFTFYTIGNFTAENNAYMQSPGRTTYDDVVKWQNRSYISLGVTAAFGAWTVIELVRYLYAADKVLPVNAKTDKHPEIYMENNDERPENEEPLADETKIIETDEIIVEQEIKE